MLIEEPPCTEYVMHVHVQEQRVSRYEEKAENGLVTSDFSENLPPSQPLSEPQMNIMQGT